MIQKIKAIKKTITGTISPITSPIAHELRRLGPTKSFVYGVILAGLANYLRYQKFEEGPAKFLTYYFATIPATSMSEVLLGSGLVMAITDGYKSTQAYFKKRIRARKLYNAWKTMPSYKTLENTVGIA